jgi:3-isopropylmalate/(R)-2-methylmalate dehydratase large subunit
MPTLAQHILARAAGRDHVDVGEIITCKVDLAMSHDSSGPRRIAPMLQALGTGIRDPKKYVVVTDHYIPPDDADSEQIIRFTRDWVGTAGIEHFYDEQGICHVVLPEHGHVRPGMLIVGGDSHSCTGGAFGAYMFGIGATEMLGVLVTGEIWLKVPGTIVLEWTNRLSDGVTAKDMALFMCGKLGMDGGQYQALEYRGEAVRSMSMQERMTLSNMAAELGAQAGLIEPDETTLDYLRSVGAEPGETAWRTDDDATFLARHTFDAARLPPQVAAPSSPANAMSIEAVEQQEIDTAYIGACTGAKLEDLRMAARILQGRRIANGKRLLVAPASLRDQKTAESDGTLRILTEAGAQILPTGCGACAGYGKYRFADGERVISSTARNFRGRMGSDGSLVWLASPYTVAASAVEGRIADPRPLLERA